VSIRQKKKKLKFSEPSMMDLLIYVQQTVERRICFWTKDDVVFQLLIMPGCSRRYVRVSSTESNEITTQRYPINAVNIDKIKKKVGNYTNNRNCVHKSITYRLNSGKACSISFRIFCITVLILKTGRLKYAELQFWLLFYVECETSPINGRT